MKKGAKPELSQKWWKKNKATTLKSTGLGAVIGAYEKKLNEVEKKPSQQGFQDCVKLLENVVPAAKKAEGMCNNKIHSETLECLKKYPAAVAKEAGVLQKKASDYDDIIKKWNKKRKLCLKGMQDVEGKLTALTNKADAAIRLCEQAVSQNDDKLKKMSSKGAGKLKKELIALQKEAKDTMDIVRIAGAAKDTPHVDDRADKIIQLFTDAINIQSRCESTSNGKQGELQKAVNSCS